MADPFAQPSDVAAVLLRDLTAAETTAATKLLVYASTMLRAKLPTIDDRIADGTLDPLLAEQVVVTAVLRVIRNPEGLRQVSRSIDDFTTTETRDNALSAGALYITDEEVGGLLPGTGLPRVGTLQLRTAMGSP